MKKIEMNRERKFSDTSGESLMKGKRTLSKRRRNAKRVTFTTCESDSSSSTESSVEYEDVLERKIEELSRHLAEEKQTSRREKINVARLHRELARYKGGKELKEKDNILKDLEKERMLRSEAEKKLQKLSLETNQSTKRFHQLQTEFSKMEQAVTQMMQFKSKIDQLKQEKSSLSVQYESNIQRYNTHISSLERENIMLLNDVKKFEQQMSSGTDQERTQLLLERLKLLETENSSLVLENEQQRQQYEKCLDEIANQVVQALLAQKALREECVKLQTRVQDLECQNKELNHLFQQKVKYSSDTVLQTLPPSQTVSTSTLCESSGYYNSVCSLPISTSVSVETMHLTTTITNNTILLPVPVAHAHNTSYISTDSLHSLVTSDTLSSITNDSLSQHSSHASSTTESLKQSEISTCRQSTSTDSMQSDDAFEEPKSGCQGNRCNTANCDKNCDNVQCRTKIETEFPATNSSPKMKHVNIEDRVKDKTKQRSSSVTSLNTGTKIRTFRSNSTNAAMTKSRLVPPGVISQSSSNVSQGHVDANSQINQSDSSTKKRSLSQPEHINKSISTVNQSKTGSKPVKTDLSKSTSRINPKLQKSSSSSNIPMKKTSKSHSSLPQSTQSKLPQKKSDIDSGRKVDLDSGKKTSGIVTNRVPKTTVTSSKTNTQGGYASKVNQTCIQAEKEAKQRETTPTNHQPARVPSFPNGQYFYDYSDEDSDINRPVSGFSNGSTMSVNEILDDDCDTDTLLDADFTAEKFAFFETPQFMQKDENKKDKGKRKKEKPLFSSLRGKPDIVKDTEYSEHKNKVKSPRSHRRRSSLPHSLKSKNNRPSSLVLNSKEKQKLQHGYSSSSLSSTDSDENWVPTFTRRYQYKTKKSGSSESGSMSGSLSEKAQMKSSQELTPTASEKSIVSPVDARDQNIYREVIVVKNNDNPNMGSLGKKKIPPPPVPKKPPVAGRRSPGIIMGIQSPGLRVKAQGQDLGVLKPHEFKTGVFENIEATVQTVIIPQDINITQGCHGNKYLSSDPNVIQNHKYMSSDSSFESVKNERVERSGSKDDGYSTMSSDIQPELMEKFSDSSLKRDTILRSDFQIRNDITVAHASESSQKFVSCGTAVLENGPTLTNTVTKRNSGNFSERHSTVTNGSLGRVKAMKQMFEAQCEKQNDNPKPFPLRKSYSFDSKLGHPSLNLNRRSLGDEVKLNALEFGEQENESLHDKTGELSNKRQENFEDKTKNEQIKGDNSIQEQIVENHNQCFQYSYQTENSSSTENHYTHTSSLDHVTLTTDHVTTRNHVTSHMTPERTSLYHMLNHSEENFLSDIPEEREDYGEMSGASNEKLLDFPHRPKMSKLAQITKLQLFEMSTQKYFWSSTQGLCRFLSESDLDKIKRKDSFHDIMESKSGRLMEKSVSLSALNTHTEITTHMRLAPTLRRSCHASLINEIAVNERVQEMVKDQILKQLAGAINSESDDDLHNYSFAQLLAKKQRQNQLEQSFESKFNQHIPSETLSSNFHSHPDFSQQEERVSDKGRDSSKESSPMIDKPSKFRSDYYSLCLVGSNRSLFSGSNEGESEPLPPEEAPCTNCKDPSKCERCIKAKNTEEFDQISRQLQSLSKTVNVLQQTLNADDSCESDEESNEDHSHMFVSPNSDFHGDGYQWIEDDEFYLTPCGGELIMGNSPFSDTGACAEWINEYADDTSCNDEFEFYGNFANEPVNIPNYQTTIKEEDETPKSEESKPVTSPESNSPVKKDPVLPQSCDSYSKQKALKNLRVGGHVRHHSEGHLPTQGQGSSGVQQGTQVQAKRGHMEGSEDRGMLDPQVRAAMLDAMVHLSGASMDSLDDNIGVDHVMCSRLIGGAEKAVVKPVGTRSAVDLSQFFSRYGEPEQEAVAAFDFLNEVPTEPVQQATSPTSSQSQRLLHDTSNNPTPSQSQIPLHDSSNNIASSQSQLPLHNASNKLTNKGPENKIQSVEKEKQEMKLIPKNRIPSPEVKVVETQKSKISKPEKKFFNFSRSKSSKSLEASKEKDSKLPKKLIKSKDPKEKDKETPKEKEKSKIPKFRSSTSDLKTAKSAKNIHENGKAGSLKFLGSPSHEHSQIASLRMNSKIVDKL